MSVSQNAALNTVSAANQLTTAPVQIVENGGAYKVLFVGNSITRHGPKPDIGWYGNWGMAASSKDKDYVHVLLSMLEKTCGAPDYGIAHVSNWERNYQDGNKLLEERYGEARDFAADIVIIRLGENMPKYSAPACKPQLCDMIDFFASNSNCKVIITDNFWKNDAKDTMIREIAEEKGYTFCHIGDIEDDKATMALGQFEHKGVSVHPSDLGMKRIAERLFETIKTVKG